MSRRRKWQPTPVFLSGESQGRESLVGCRPWGRTESDTTEVTAAAAAAAGLNTTYQSLVYDLIFLLILYPGDLYTF